MHSAAPSAEMVQASAGASRSRRRRYFSTAGVWPQGPASVGEAGAGPSWSNTGSRQEGCSDQHIKRFSMTIFRLSPFWRWVLVAAGAGIPLAATTGFRWAAGLCRRQTTRTAAALHQRHQPRPDYDRRLVKGLAPARSASPPSVAVKTTLTGPCIVVAPLRSTSSSEVPVGLAY